MIARIHTPSPPIRKLVHELLVSVGREHPQALVPLTVATKSHSKARCEAAKSILEVISRHSRTLVDQVHHSSGSLAFTYSCCVSVRVYICRRVLWPRSYSRRGAVA